MNEQPDRMRSLRVLAVISVAISGGLLGWFAIGPPLVERWVLLDSPGASSYQESLLHRDVTMLIGALLGATIAVILVALAAAARRAIDRQLPLSRR